MGRIDAYGYLTIVGRSKYLIISGGLNVYPAEVEGYINDTVNTSPSNGTSLVRAASLLAMVGGAIQTGVPLKP